MFASKSDYQECSRLHRKFGTTYYFASRRLPVPVRQRVDAVYGFVRLPDEWVDNPIRETPEEILTDLQDYRQQFLSADFGIKPTYAVLRAFTDTCAECDMDRFEPLRFLDAMEQDLSQTQYETYEELRGYMRGSAGSVGVMLLSALGAERDSVTQDAALKLAEAMQMTNFMRDVKEDWERGRVYLPQDELAQFGLSNAALDSGIVSEAWVNLMKFQIERARQLFSSSDEQIELLPESVRFGVKLARKLYAMILDKIEQNGYDVFSSRVGTTPQEKIVVAWQLWESTT